MKLGPLRKVGPLGVALTVGQVAWTLHQHWQAIPAEDRDRLRELLRETRGKPSNLSKSKRRELRELVRKLDVPQLARQTARTVLLPGKARRPS